MHLRTAYTDQQVLSEPEAALVEFRAQAHFGLSVCPPVPLADLSGRQVSRGRVWHSDSAPERHLPAAGGRSEWPLDAWSCHSSWVY
jgi:hypothetical protein